MHYVFVVAKLAVGFILACSFLYSLLFAVVVLIARRDETRGFFRLFVWGMILYWEFWKELFLTKIMRKKRKTEEGLVVAVTRDGRTYFGSTKW